MSLQGKGIGAILFGGAFGAMFVYFGIQRIFVRRKGPDRGQAILWGMVGILLGIATFRGIVWLCTPIAETTNTTPFSDHSHP